MAESKKKKEKKKKQSREEERGFESAALLWIGWENHGVKEKKKKKKHIWIMYSCCVCKNTARKKFPELLVQTFLNHQISFFFSFRLSSFTLVRLTCCLLCQRKLIINIRARFVELTQHAKHAEARWTGVFRGTTLLYSLCNSSWSNALTVQKSEVQCSVKHIEAKMVVSVDLDFSAHSRVYIQ